MQRDSRGRRSARSSKILRLFRLTHAATGPVMLAGRAGEDPVGIDQ
jgi:hypothetical protein